MVEKSVLAGEPFMVTTFCVLSEDADTTTGLRTANECQGRIPRNLAEAKREQEGTCGVGSVEIFICAWIC